MIAVIALLPLFIRQYYVGNDTMFHAANIKSLSEQLKMNFLFPSNVVGSIANNFGYGTTLFYSPLPHFLGAYLNLIFSNIGVTLKVIHLIALFASGLTMFFLSKTISNSSKIGLLSATIYMLFPYHLSDIYVRDALGECLLFIFLPLIILSIYHLYQNNFKKFYPLFVIGYVGGILSHLNLMFYVTIFILLFMLLNIKKTIKHLKPLIIGSIFILLIASPFLSTLIQHKLFGNYAVFIDGVMVQGTQWWGLNLYDFFNVFSKFRLDTIKFYIDIIVLILLLFTTINYKKLNTRKYNYIFIFLIIIMFTSTRVFPWDLLPRSVRMIQFPWRLEVIVATLISLLAPICIILLKRKQQTIVTYTAIYVMLFISVITFSINFDNKIISYNYLKDNALNYETGMGWQKEYLPANTFNDINYFNNRNHDIIVKEGIGSVSIIDNNVPSLSFKVLGDVTIEMPRLYYLGYSLTDGNKNYHIYENEYGFIETKLTEGTYYLRYEKEHIFTIISFVSIMGLVIFIRREYEKN